MAGADDGVVTLTGTGGTGGTAGAATPADFTGTVADATGRIDGSTGAAIGSVLGWEADAALLEAGFTGGALFWSAKGEVPRPLVCRGTTLIGPVGILETALV